MLIDTHAHLYWKEYEQDIDEVIKRSIDAGVKTIINVGVDVKKSKLALKQIQDKFSNIPAFSAYSTIGIHPHEALNYAQSGQTSSDLPDRQAGRGTNVLEDIALLQRIYNNNPTKIVAVGECGLDYYFRNIDHHVANAPRDDVIASEAWQSQIKSLQKKLFQAQIDLAKKLNLPLIVHCRDDRSKNPQNTEAWDEVIDMTKDHFGIYHCYSGLPHTTSYILQSTNFLVSFAGNLTYPKNDYLKEAMRTLPLEKIVLETDCPFLPPQSKRGQRNEPANVLEIAQLVAELKDVPLEEVANQTTSNIKRLFKLK